jgi:hypothetical protein
VTFPEGLVRCAFDNEQVVGKSYKVKANTNMPASVITSHMYIKIDASNNIQSNPDFAPTNWLFTQPSEKQVNQFVSPLNSSADECVEDDLLNSFRETSNYHGIASNP